MNVARSPALPEDADSEEEPPRSPKGGSSLWLSVATKSREVDPSVTSEESESVAELFYPSGRK